MPPPLPVPVGESAVIATVVDWAALRDVVVASLAAGVGVTVAFSLAILGLTRFADMRRDGAAGRGVGLRRPRDRRARGVGARVVVSASS